MHRPLSGYQGLHAAVASGAGGCALWGSRCAGPATNGSCAKGDWLQLPGVKLGCACCTPVSMQGCCVQMAGLQTAGLSH